MTDYSQAFSLTSGTDNRLETALKNKLAEFNPDNFATGYSCDAYCIDQAKIIVNRTRLDLFSLVTNLANVLKETLTYRDVDLRSTLSILHAMMEGSGLIDADLYTAGIEELTHHAKANVADKTGGTTTAHECFHYMPLGNSFLYVLTNYDNDALQILADNYNLNEKRHVVSILLKDMLNMLAELRLLDINDSKLEQAGTVSEFLLLTQRKMLMMTSGYLYSESGDLFAAEPYLTQRGYKQLIALLADMMESNLIEVCAIAEITEPVVFLTHHRLLFIENDFVSQHKKNADLLNLIKTEMVHVKAVIRCRLAYMVDELTETS